MSHKEIIDKIPNAAFNWIDEPAMIYVDKEGNRWFLAVDISRSLGYSRYRDGIKRHVSPDNIKRFGEIRDMLVSSISNRVRDDWNFINEEGLYEFIDTSNRKEYAKELKKKYW